MLFVTKKNVLCVQCMTFRVSPCTCCWIGHLGSQAMHVWSPDLSPNDRLWRHMKDVIYWKKSRTREELLL